MTSIVDLKMIKHRIALITVSLLLLAVACNVQKGNTYFNDPTVFFTKTERTKMKNKLQQLNTTDKYKLFVYVVRADNAKKPGEHRASVFANIDDNIRKESVLIYLAYADKKIFIVTGERIKNYLTDSLCSYTISRMTPAFAKADYYTGLDIGINTVDSIIVNTRYVTF